MLKMATNIPRTMNAPGGSTNKLAPWKICLPQIDPAPINSLTKPNAHIAIAYPKPDAKPSIIE